jgi:hypothetical protein
VVGSSTLLIGVIRLAGKPDLAARSWAAEMREDGMAGPLGVDMCPSFGAGVRDVPNERRNRAETVPRHPGKYGASPSSMGKH